MKISNQIEEIFAQAVALDQSGGLRNTIFAVGSEIFIMNYDHTVLLRFKLRKSEVDFEHPISFKANDYDSNVFEEKDGRVIFSSKSGSYERKKVCGTSDITPEEVKTLFSTYNDEDEERQVFVLSSDLLPLLEEELSHVEFNGKVGGNLTLTQRNIYSGGIVEIQKKQEGMFTEAITAEFGPVAIKTGDFKALFTFQDQLKFKFPNNGKEDYIVVKGINDTRRNMTAIVACCLYDEIIKIKEVVPGETSSTPTVTRRRN